VSPPPKNPAEDGGAKAAPAAAEAPAEAKAGRKEKGTEKGSEKGAEKEKGGKGKDKEGKGKGGKGPAEGASGGKKAAKPIPDNPNFRYIVRLAGADLDGRRTAALALTGVSGIGLRLANVACQMAGVPASEMIGNLPEATVEGIEAVLGALPERLPPWMLNHPTDGTTGETHHYISGDLETARRDDVNRMKMIRSYRGVRHERGQKVRGQRTRSNGRTGMAAGVLKKAAKEQAAAKAAETGGGGGGGAAPAAPAAPAAAPKAGSPAKAAAKPAEKKE
jgi:small subunit ribosomal protein S13